MKHSRNRDQPQALTPDCAEARITEPGSRGAGEPGSRRAGASGLAPRRTGPKTEPRKAGRRPQAQGREQRAESGLARRRAQPGQNQACLPGLRNEQSYAPIFETGMS